MKKIILGIACLGLLAMLIGQAAPNCQAGGSLHVIDGNGNDLGLLTNMEQASNNSGPYFYMVYDTTLCGFYKLFPWNGQRALRTGGNMFFVSIDCTGDAYIDSYASLEEILGSSRDNVFHAYKVVSYVEDIEFNSELKTTGECVQQYYHDTNGASLINPTELLLDRFAPAPCHLELR